MTGPVPVAGPMGPGVEYVFTPDAADWARMTRMPGGAVSRDLARRAELVRLAAERQIPLGAAHAGPQPRRVADRHLRDTVRTRIAYSGMAEPVAFVGSDHPIALIHHEGSRPHTIVPRRARFLVFYPRGGNTLVFARKVNHPGTKGNRFLTDNIHLAIQ